MINLRGEVIDINTAIACASGGNEGIGFSIPINIAARVARQLTETGQVGVWSGLGSTAFVVETNRAPHFWHWQRTEIIEATADLSQWFAMSDVIYPVFVRAPNWFWLTIFATLAAVPWIKWRFSLRTLLIVLTLFALFFGAIAMSL